MKKNLNLITFLIFIATGSFLSFRFFYSDKPSEKTTTTTPEETNITHTNAKEMTDNTPTQDSIGPAQNETDKPAKKGLDQLTTKELADRYKKLRDHESLQAFSKTLQIGMNRVELESMLGEADYSPIDGQYYYLTKKTSDEQTETIGLVISFNDSNGIQTDKLQNIHYGVIGE